jgi:hypothetical protein
VEEELDLVRRVRWKLALGQVDEPLDSQLSRKEQKIDEVLDRLYRSSREGGMTDSRKITAQWMGDIKSLFPSPVVRILQNDALERYGIRKLLSQPAFLDEVEPDVGMVSAILSARESLSPSAIQAARYLVGRLARQIENKLRFKLISRIHGIRDHQRKVKNPRHREIDWHLTIRQNLKHFQPSLGTIIPQTMIGRPRKKNQSKRIIILSDQSASMAESFVYAGILGSIMASVSSIKTNLVIFDTEVVDLTEYLGDPVELLFRAQLGGGTDIRKALQYAAGIAYEEVGETYVLLISDLFEGGPVNLMYDMVKALIDHQIRLVSLLALDDQGMPAYDKVVAKKLADLGIPSFGCTPELFPELISAALNNESLQRFATSGG